MSTTISMNVHRTKSIEVQARDIGSFWTLQFVAKDRDEGSFTVDVYAGDGYGALRFDREEMQSFADALREGAASVEALIEKKCGCEHKDLEMTEVAKCIKCGDKFDIFDKE